MPKRPKFEYFLDFSLKETFLSWAFGHHPPILGGGPSNGGVLSQIPLCLILILAFFLVFGSFGPIFLIDFEN